MIHSLPAPLKEALMAMQIEKLTPIQEQSIPLILDGKNVVGLAETGSGKSLAYLLPLISKIIGLAKNPTRLLVVTPTKELSEQILSVAKKCAQSTNVLSMSLYGGKSFSEQERALKKGVHLIVACPGRLAEHIEKKTIDLSGIESLVLDEADQLMDMGFLPQIKKVLEAASSRRQTLLFSATMSEAVRLLVDEFLPTAETIDIEANATKSSITEVFCPIDLHLRYPFLRFLLKHHKIKSGLIFTQTKEESRKLHALLAHDHYKCAVLEGDMTSHQRKKSLMAFKEKTIHLLVATDIASRGLDVPHVTHVINFSPPPSEESYIHRAGRSARHTRAGQVITLYTPEEKADLEKLLTDRVLSPTKYKDFNYQLKITKKRI